MSVTVSALEGQLSRTWNYVSADGRCHVITLYHDTITGVRSAMLDFEEVPSSLGNSVRNQEALKPPQTNISFVYSHTQSLIMDSAGHKIHFMLGDNGGFVEIARSGYTNFTYRCSVNNVFITEATQEIASQQGMVFKVDVAGTGSTPDDDDVDKHVTWYVVKATRVSDGAATTVHRRFKEFADLNSQVKQNLKGHHLRSSLPNLPEKTLKLTQDHSNPAFIEHRKCGLQQYIKMLVSVPHVPEMNCVKAFLGLINNIRELSIVFKKTQLGLSLNPCDKNKTTPAIVGAVLSIDNAPGIFTGDAISKINGMPVAGDTFKGVIHRLKITPRPMIVHFIQLMGTPQLLGTPTSVQNTLAQRAAASAASTQKAISSPITADIVGGTDKDDSEEAETTVFTSLQVPTTSPATAARSGEKSSGSSSSSTCDPLDVTGVLNIGASVPFAEKKKLNSKLFDDGDDLLVDLSLNSTAINVSSPDDPAPVQEQIESDTLCSDGAETYL